MSFSAIEKILEDATGLDSSSIGSNVVHRVVKQRMELAGVGDVDSYHTRLEQDKNELQALIEDVTVPETWFFRDREPFGLLAELVRADWHPPSKDRPLRILSIPCATGEEAYSIAMVMLDLGYDASSVRIDAVDISKRALARAVAGEYRANSFRGDEGHYRRRFFDRNGTTYRINDKLRRMVSFWHGNLLDEKFLAGTDLYDVIFCRNVMIYFTRELQDRAILKLHRLLGDRGLLFVGHAEAAKLTGELFTSVRRSGTFAFRKRLPAIKPIAEAISETPGPADKAVSIRPQPTFKAQSGRRVSDKVPGQDPTDAAGATVSLGTVVTKNPADPLPDIRRMADEGQLEEAARLCLRFLEGHTASAEGYYLMGLIREAEAQDVEAGNLFRKAVYLDPHHYEALVHLAVLAEAQGNAAAAAVYRARASRLKEA